METKKGAPSAIEDVKSLMVISGSQAGGANRTPSQLWLLIKTENRFQVEPCVETVTLLHQAINSGDVTPSRTGF